MSQPAEPFPFRKAALALGGALLAGYVVVAAMTAWDRQARPELEVLKSETAAGVPVVLPEPWPPDPTRPVLTRDGQPYYVRRPEDDLKHERDWQMIRSGHDESGRIPLYRYFTKGQLGDRYFFKVAPGQYYELSLRPGKAAPVTPEAASPP